MRLSRQLLRPSKVRSALRRRVFERQVPRVQMRSVPSGLVTLGTDYGGWTIPEGFVEPDWMCYSVGAGGDISFDLELMARYGVRVRSFDAVGEYVQRAREQAGEDPRFSAHQAAIALSDGPLRMQVTHDDVSSSVSSAGLYESSEFVELPGRTLPSLMAELGDERIDLLKLDIEGAEYERAARDRPAGARREGVRHAAPPHGIGGAGADPDRAPAKLGLRARRVQAGGEARVLARRSARPDGGGGSSVRPGLSLSGGSPSATRPCTASHSSCARGS